MKNRSEGRLGGFTLIELLVVVLIIGILTAVALPQYQKAVEKARAAEVVSTLSSLEKAMDVYLLGGGTARNLLPGGGLAADGSLDIGINCTPADNGCKTKNFSYSAEVFPQANDGVVAIAYAYRNSDSDYYVLTAERLQSGDWVKKCGWFSSTAKAVCDGLVSNGYQSIENYDY